MMGLLGLIPSGVKMALVAALVAAAGAFYWHYTGVVADRNDALAEVGALEVENRVQDETISSLKLTVDRWAEAAEQMQATLNELTVVNREATEQQRKLNDVLSKHDLTALSVAKPGLLELRINGGTADILRMFEHSTGGGPDGAR